MNKVLLHKSNLDEKLKEVTGWKINSDDKDKLVEFCHEYLKGNITNKIGTNPEANVLRNLYFLKVGLENISKQTKEEIDRFHAAVMSDNIRTFDKATGEYTGKIIAMRSKKAIFKMLSVYFGWKYKEKSYDLCKVLNKRITIKESDVDSLSPEELKEVYETIPQMFPEQYVNERLFLVKFLASSGCRAEEFHNIRYSDIEMPRGENIFLKVRLRSEFSKTKGRTIELFDKDLLPIARKFFAKRLDEGMESEDPIYRLGYDGVRKWLRELGKKSIGKTINYHLFRHTAATHLASKLNRNQLCIYFGWKFSSPMPDVYIQRSGVEMKNLSKKFKQTDMEEMQIEFEGKIKAMKEDFEEEKKNIKKEIASEIRQQLLRELSDMENKASQVFNTKVSYKAEGDKLIDSIKAP